MVSIWPAWRVGRRQETGIRRSRATAIRMASGVGEGERRRGGDARSSMIDTPLVRRKHGGIPVAVVEVDWLVAGGQWSALCAGADGPPVESPLQAELPRVASDLVAEDANVVQNRLDPRGDVL